MSFVHSPKIVTDGLVLSLDAGNVKSYPGSGTVWTDKSGFNNNGTLTNGPTFNSANGGSIVFDGTNDYVELNRVVQDDFSLCCWFRTTQSYAIGGNTTKQWYFGAGLVDAEVANVVNDFGMTLQLGKVDFGVGNPDVTLQSPLTYNDDVWHYAVGTRNKTTGVINLYVDGELKDTGIGNTNSLTAPSKIRIGSQQTNLGFYSGKISTVQIYNRVLTQTEILQNYNATKSRFGLI
jgi:hypothetical protein